MKKRFIFLIVIAALIIFYVFSKALVFSWVNPYTNTESFPYIAKTIGNLGKAFNYAQSASKKEGKEYKYLFWNAYGSGFMKHNPIPNDLDFSVGIDLGEYDYYGDNAEAIAKHLVDKMQSFQQNFNFYITTNPEGRIWSTLSPLEFLTTANFNKYGYQNCIEEHLDEALSGKEYIHYAKKRIQEENFDKIIDIPYMMRHNEILLEEYKPMLMFSDNIYYNDVMPHYMRELTIMPEFFVTINQNGKKTIVELVPESYLGARLQFSRRAFASNVFIGNCSVNFQKHAEYINNDEEFLFYRMFTFRRHLQEVENIAALQNKPVKLFKRIMQTADSIYPLLEEEKYQEISDWVETNLSKPELQAINEYENICRNILSITTSMELFETLYRNQRIQVMYNELGKVLKTIEDNNYVDKETLNAMKNYYNNEINMVLDYKQFKNFPLQRKEIIKANFLTLTEKMNQARYQQIENPEKIQEYIDLFNSIFIKSGHHRVDFCWLDKNTTGIVKDEFTSKISDFHKFALENELADLNYKLINKSDIPFEVLRYEVWAKYHPTKEEENAYEEMNKLLLKDKVNFNIKKKIIFNF